MMFVLLLGPLILTSVLQIKKKKKNWYYGSNYSSENLDVNFRIPFE